MQLPWTRYILGVCDIKVLCLYWSETFFLVIYFSLTLRMASLYPRWVLYYKNLFLIFFFVFLFFFNGKSVNNILLLCRFSAGGEKIWPKYILVRWENVYSSELNAVKENMVWKKLKQLIETCHQAKHLMSQKEKTIRQITIKVCFLAKTVHQL